MIIIGSVVENAFFEIVTGAINRMFVFVVADVTTTVLLVDGMENVEELADARHFIIGRKGMGAREAGFHKA